jgi:hypothetical protein
VRGRRADAAVTDELPVPVPVPPNHHDVWDAPAVVAQRARAIVIPGG